MLTWMQSMIEFEQLPQNDFIRNELVKKLLEIGRSICKEKRIEINGVEYDMVTFDDDCWIDINFKIQSDEPKMLAQMNVTLAERLEQYRDFLTSDMEYIPSFVSGE